MKATYKKSRARMTKKDIEYVKLFTQENINIAFKEYNMKQKKLTKLIVKKEKKRKGKKRKKNKRKKVIKEVTVLPTTLVTSEYGSGTQVSDSEG
jgi:hypothetical protein